MTASEAWQFLGNLCAAAAILSALTMGMASRTSTNKLRLTLSVLGIWNFVWIILTDAAGFFPVTQIASNNKILKEFILGFTHIFMMYEISLFCLAAIFCISASIYDGIVTNIFLKIIPIFSFLYYIFIQLFLGHSYSYFNSQMNGNEIAWLISEVLFVVFGFAFLKTFFRRETSANPTEREFKC